MASSQRKALRMQRLGHRPGGPAQHTKCIRRCVSLSHTSGTLLLELAVYKIQISATSGYVARTRSPRYVRASRHARKSRTSSIGRR